jgi:hypothetical protein
MPRQAGSCRSCRTLGRTTTRTIHSAAWKTICPHCLHSGSGATGTTRAASTKSSVSSATANRSSHLFSIVRCTAALARGFARSACSWNKSNIRARVNLGSASLQQALRQARKSLQPRLSAWSQGSQRQGRLAFKSSCSATAVWFPSFSKTSRLGLEIFFSHKPVHSCLSKRRPTPRVRPNPSLEGTRSGMALGPRGAVVHVAPRGPSAMPTRAPQLKRYASRFSVR